MRKCPIAVMPHKNLKTQKVAKLGENAKAVVKVDKAKMFSVNANLRPILREKILQNSGFFSPFRY